MRCILALSLLITATACDAKPAQKSTSNNALVRDGTEAAPEAVTLKAADGVTIHGRWYKAANPRALVLLFHQAGSSKDEYATIAPRLVRAGFSALAIDQRAGGGLFGNNETLDALDRQADYLEARPDLQAALDWAQAQRLPIILWGSSYSSSLIFPIAAEDPQGIVALLSFSPGEYFDDNQLIRRAAAKVTVPVFVASTNSGQERAEADPIFAALPASAGNVRFVPRRGGAHGSSTLIATRNRTGAESNWSAVTHFLDRVAPRR